MDGNVIELVCDKLQWLLDNPTTTWSGIGIYALSLTGSTVLVIAACVRRRKKKSPAGNEFTCNGGEQNINQGNNAVGKQVNNYFSQPLKQRTLIIATLAAAGVMYILPGASGSGLSSLTVVVDEPELLAEMVRTGISPMHPIIKKKERLK